MKMNMEKVGNYCKSWRIEHGYTQGQIARDCHCSIQNVSIFEKGKNDSLRIFVWYCNHGLKVSEMYTEVVDRG